MKPLISKKICLLSDHHISLNPRLWKEAFFYEQIGFEVVVITMLQSNYFLEKDRKILSGHNIKYIAYLNLISGSNNNPNILFYRIRKRISSELHRFFRFGLPWAISYSPEKLYQSALKESADIYIAHLECAFYVGRKLIKAGKKVAFDFEDWYSRDYLVPERPVKLLESVERYAILNGLFVTAASSSMAEEIKKAYSSSRNLETIYNGFSISENSDQFNSKVNNVKNDVFKIIWFSRNIGPNRGIEYFMSALEYCKIKCEIHLLGLLDNGFDSVLNNYISVKDYHSLHFHKFIPHDEILKFIASFDLGLALDLDINDNRNLTITNKIFQYIQAGLPVLCSKTKGHLEVASFFPNLIHAVDIQNQFEVAQKIDFLSNHSITYSNDDKMKFREVFSWEAQQKKLINLINLHFSDEKISH